MEKANCTIRNTKSLPLFSLLALTASLQSIPLSAQDTSTTHSHKYYLEVEAGSINTFGITVDLESNSSLKQPAEWLSIKVGYAHNRGLRLGTELVVSSWLGIISGLYLFQEIEGRQPIPIFHGLNTYLLWSLREGIFWYNAWKGLKTYGYCPNPFDPTLYEPCIIHIPKTPPFTGIAPSVRVRFSFLHRPSKNSNLAIELPVIILHVIPPVRLSSETCKSWLPYETCGLYPLVEYGLRIRYALPIKKQQ